MRLDFLGIGFGRSASTWLTYCLYEHPEISIPKFNLETEINYFPEEYEIMGLKNYIKKFLNCNFEKKVGELSTLIAHHERSPKLIKKLFPNTKIIIYYRDPKKRAESEYMMTKEFDLLEANLEDLEYNQEEIVKRWVREFGKDNVFVFDMEKREKKEQEKELHRLFRFLGVKEITPPSFTRDSKAYREIERYTSNWANREKKIHRKPKSVFIRKTINYFKYKLRANKKLFYTIKRSFGIDYYFQWINRRI